MFDILMCRTSVIPNISILKKGTFLKIKDKKQIKTFLQDINLKNKLYHDKKVYHGEKNETITLRTFIECGSCNGTNPYNG